MDKTEFYFEMQVKENHLDRFGHVNNAVYLQFLELARWKILDDSHLGMEQIIKDQCGPVVLEINIQYRNELKLGEKISISSQTIEANSKIIQMGQVIKKEDGSVSAKAKITIGLMDLDKRKLIEFTAPWQKCLGLEPELFL